MTGKLLERHWYGYNHGMARVFESYQLPGWIQSVEFVGLNWLVRFGWIGWYEVNVLWMVWMVLVDRKPRVISSRECSIPQSRGSQYCCSAVHPNVQFPHFCLFFAGRELQICCCLRLYAASGKERESPIDFNKGLKRGLSDRINPLLRFPA